MIESVPERKSMTHKERHNRHRSKTVLRHLKSPPWNGFDCLKLPQQLQPYGAAGTGLIPDV